MDKRSWHEGEVDVYWNIRKQMFSIKVRSGSFKGRVMDHVSSIFIADARFIVSDPGRERVRRHKRKNVHAFVRGVISAEKCSSKKRGQLITYNPYKHDGFVLLDGLERVESAALVRLETDYALERPKIIGYGVCTKGEMR